MYAYVKNLTAGIKNPFSICHTSRIFDYVSENRRRKFDPKKYDVNTSYGIVISSNLVKHQVILVKESKEELEKAVSEDEGRLRSIRVPRRLSNGPISQPLKDFTLIEENERQSQSESKISEARKTVADQKNAKLLKKLEGKGLKDKPKEEEMDVSRNCDAASPAMGDAQNGTEPSSLTVVADSSHDQNVSKISEARKTVADQKNAKLLKKLEGKGLKDKPKEEEMDVSRNCDAASPAMGDAQNGKEPSSLTVVADSSHDQNEIRSGEAGKFPVLGSVSVSRKLKNNDDMEPAMKKQKPDDGKEVGREVTPVLAETSDKQSKELKVQLEMALNEAETYRLKYESVKSTLTEVKDRDKRLANIERDVADIKRYLSIPKGKIDGSHVSKPCKLSLLKDVAPCDQEEYDIPTDAVHMGDGKLFISKKKIAKAEKKHGLRPRLKALLKYTFKNDIEHCRRVSEGAKVKAAPGVKDILDHHVKALIAVLKALKWLKEPNLEMSHISREISKALSELKADKYPMSSDSESEANSVHPSKNEDGDMDVQSEMISGQNDDENVDVLEKSFHETYED